MQDWECMIRMPSDYIQTMMIEAYNYSDAKTIAESSTGGKLLNATPQWYDNNNNDDAEDNNDTDIDGGLILFGLAVILIMYAWKWILLIGGIAICIWGIIKTYK